MSAPQQYTITFRTKRDVAAHTEMFLFEKPEGFTFTPGQFATLRLPAVAQRGDVAGAVRAFSFASAPSDDELAFAWRQSDSAFKRAADALVEGDTIEMIAPAGHAVLPPTGPVVFLIGGIGITPVRSILREVRATKQRRDLTLLYSNRTPKDAPFFEEMSTYSDVCKVVHTMTEAVDNWDGETGFITADMVRRHVPACADATYYIVGTSGFVRAMESVVAQLGVPHEKIVCDNFG